MATGGDTVLVSQPEPSSVTLDVDQALTLLAAGQLEVEGRLIGASNATLLCTVSADGLSALSVHKPVAGERPLWDFPDGTLAFREVAAYAVSQATGWDVVPPTVLREGPFGPGMCQLWIDVDESVDTVALARSDSQVLRRMAVLDAVINNTDRKIGHLLPVSSGHVYGVDHGVCFSVEDKLRTVLWQWAGSPLTDEAVEVLRALDESLLDGGALDATLRSMLAGDEVAATRRRVRRMLRSGRHPRPRPNWPHVPWPPY